MIPTMNNDDDKARAARRPYASATLPEISPPMAAGAWIGGGEDDGAGVANGDTDGGGAGSDEIGGGMVRALCSSSLTSKVILCDHQLRFERRETKCIFYRI